MGWLIFLAYFGGFLILGWKIAVALRDKDIRDTLDRYPYAFRTPKEVTEFDSSAPFILFGYLLAVVWPLTVPIMLLIPRIRMVTPIEKEFADREELEKLRKLAKEHNLDYPEVKD